jgi:hypothetical protein
MSELEELTERNRELEAEHLEALKTINALLHIIYSGQSSE